MSERLVQLSTPGEPISLGKTGREFKGLDAIKLRNKPKEGERKATLRKVDFTTNELTAFCPVTRQPDIYSVVIEVDPIEHSIETKSLKLYFESFRESAIYAEDVAVKIATDIFEACKPYFVSVKVTQNIRGGIQLMAEAVLSSDFEEAF